MRDSPSTNLGPVSTPRPHPLPGPKGLDTDELRVTFDDLLADSVGVAVPAADEPETVGDDQVAALDGAHELLARALASLDTQH